ncbi:MAG: hypothetical protein QUV20_06925 [Oceanibaculum nanhaiense]|uniref:hypothetical protein n=1 Tax=Oceanibaculum nanhaiense TaxID=1909734 RepID=UPI0025A3D256|nr:hypothetical protein [Oceanibaculum nanhaiense]MDM7946052.1 hypothetical protein [Oceanibaculum nanhaiense]
MTREIADDAAAPAAIRSIYEDIRAVLGSPVVNLVYRRLAGQGEDVLRDSWRLLRPAYLDGRIARYAAPLALIVPKDMAMPGALPPATAGDMPAIRAVIAAYNANNARNLVAFSALLGLEPGGTDFPPLDGGAGMPDAPSGIPIDRPIPALPAFDSLPEALQQTIRRLNLFGGTGEEGAPIASLYVHLSHWPEMLAYVERLLQPLHDAGTLTRWRVETSDRAAMAPLSDLRAPAELRTILEPILGALVRRTIPKMVPIGTYLGRALKPGASG